MSIKARMAAYQASLAEDSKDVPTSAEVIASKPPVDAPRTTLRERQAAYAESTAAINAERGVDPPPGGKSAAKQGSEPAAVEEPLETLLPRLEAGEVNAVDLTFHGELTRLSQAAKSEAIGRLARAGEAIETLKLNSIGLDNSNADALAHLIRGNARLWALQLEGNALTEPGIVTIAAAMDAHPSLTEVSFASQKATISTPAVSRLIDAMEATPNLISCNVGSLRDDTMRRRHQAACMANTDKMRQRRNAQRKAEGTAASDGGATRRRSLTVGTTQATTGAPTSAAAAPARGRAVSESVSKRMEQVGGSITRVLGDATRTVDWQAEAARIGASEPFEYGLPPDTVDKAAAASGGVYTAANGLWARASLEERLGVVRAFRTNRRIHTVLMPNLVPSGTDSDTFAAAWASVLEGNASLTKLNLESNAIQTDGILALARAVGSPSCKLAELRLANQRSTHTQAAEEAMAEAVASNPNLRTMTLNTRSTRAREQIEKALQANMETMRRQRVEGGAGGAEAAAAAGREEGGGGLIAVEETREEPDALLAAQLSRAKPTAVRRAAHPRTRRRAESAPVGTPEQQQPPPPPPPRMAEKEAAAAPRASAAAEEGSKGAAEADGSEEVEIVRSMTWAPAMKKQQKPGFNIGAAAAQAGTHRLNRVGGGDESRSSLPSRTTAEPAQPAVLLKPTASASLGAARPSDVDKPKSAIDEFKAKAAARAEKGSPQAVRSSGADKPNSALEEFKAKAAARAAGLRDPASSLPDPTTTRVDSPSATRGYAPCAKVGGARRSPSRSSPRLAARQAALDETKASGPKVSTKLRQWPPP